MYSRLSIAGFPHFQHQNESTSAIVGESFHDITDRIWNLNLEFGSLYRTSDTLLRRRTSENFVMCRLVVPALSITDAAPVFSVRPAIRRRSAPSHSHNCSRYS